MNSKEDHIPESLRSYITEAWYSNLDLKSQKDLYLPKTYTFIAILLKGSVTISLNSGKPQISPIFCLNGIMHKKKAIIRFDGNFESICIGLSGLGFKKLFDKSPFELHDTYIDMTQWLNFDVSAIIQEVQKVITKEEKIAIILSFLSNSFNKKTYQSPIATIIEQIAPEKLIQYDVKGLASLCCLGEKTFYRKFKEEIGTTPKNYINLHRFRIAFTALNSGTNQTLHSLALSLNYYDLQHMIKDFQLHTGYTPYQFLQGRSGNAGLIWNE